MFLSLICVFTRRLLDWKFMYPSWHESFWLTETVTVHQWSWNNFTTILVNAVSWIRRLWFFWFVYTWKDESLQPCKLLSKAFLKCRNTYSEDEAANTLSELARILEKIVTTVEPRDSSISSSFTIFLSFCTTSFTLSEVSCCPSPVRFRSWLAISAAFSVSIQNQAKRENNALLWGSNPE